MNALIDQFTKSWATLSQFGLLIIGIVGGFLLAPPSLWPDAGTGTILVATWFSLTVLLALLLYACLRYGSAAHRRGWIVASLISLVIGVGSLTIYMLLVAEWSCPYDDGRLVIGSSLTALGSKLSIAHPLFTCKEMIASAIGRTNDVWEQSGLISRFLFLILAFFVSLLGCASAIISVLQLLRIAQAPNE